VYPNPFNPATTIRFILPQASDVTLDIYNAAGQKIRTLATGRMEAGEHNVRWNGLLDSGVSAASGIYFARLRAGNVFTASRMMLVR
jgi:flagellar hook assembly protein FlgD